MSRTLKIVGPEGHGVTVQTINDLLQQKFLEIKRDNPRGFLDEFEMRFEILCMDIADDLGAKFTIVDDTDSMGNPCDGLVFAFGCSVEAAVAMGES